ncbi:MAG TPA: response regulator [Caulobacteraceae bacterium]|jgi:CheY-like chemotaxis protein/anti-sigma regulatory factor (Ser/Thr protein kinase)
MSRRPRQTGIPHEHLAALSHEFRTPLNGVIGMARLLEGTRLTAEQRAYVDALTESGEHLLGLVNDVLDYARLGAGRVDLIGGPLAPEDLLRQVSELLSPKAHEKGVEIGWAADAGLAPVLADEGRLRQILLNLAGNAVKFVETGGVMILAERAGDGRLRFTVSDTGPGVPEAERARIFEAFAQGGSGRDARQIGAGLGLAIATRLADAMGGQLGVGGVAGRGADFWFEAPFERADGAAPAPSLTGRTVAVASSSPIVRETAARQIEASGGRAVRAASLDAALAGTGEGDVILVDHLMAGPRGLIPPPARAGVVLLRPEERERIATYRAAGFGGYLIKPLRRASLVERVLAAGQAAAADDDRVAPRRAASAGGSGGVRVLLAEDNPINAMLAGTLLKREGAVVEHVTSGEAALDALAVREFDVVLMDVRMPGLGGLEAARVLRARGVDTPVVALTANAFDDDRRACLEAGMDDFLVKPLSLDALQRALARWTGPGWTRPRRRAKVAS